MAGLNEIPPDLPVPENDGAAAHLFGRDMPSVTLPSTAGAQVDLSALTGARTVLYAYPMTGQADGTLPSDDWDMIPGARGCTPEACAFRDHHAELEDLGADVFGLSTQTTGYQREVVERLHLPFDILSDCEFALTDALALPTFAAGGMRLLKRHTLVIRAGRIEHVFYPIFPPDGHAEEVCAWLSANQI